MNNTVKRILGPVVRLIWLLGYVLIIGCVLILLLPFHFTLVMYYLITLLLTGNEIEYNDITQKATDLFLERPTDYLDTLKNQFKL